MAETMNARIPKDLRPTLPPRAFRGNCDCGRWLVVLHSFNKEKDALVCECGFSWFWAEDTLRRTGTTDTRKHLRFLALEREYQGRVQEMRHIVDVILHHGGPHFPILTYGSGAEAIDALMEWVKGPEQSND